MNAPRKALPAIDTARCTGCGWCVAVCAPHVLSLQVQGPQAWGPKRSRLHDAAACTGCALCAVRCPFDAIRMVRVGPSHAVRDDAVLSHTSGGAAVV
jgi:ferredoxin